MAKVTTDSDRMRSISLQVYAGQMTFWQFPSHGLKNLDLYFFRLIILEFVCCALVFLSSTDLINCESVLPLWVMKVM